MNHSGITNAEGLHFVPLGGVGEIGMNCCLYGWAGKWLMVDLGITFPNSGQPGIDVIMPDVGFAESLGEDLLGLVLTHAHEDHLGAVPHLWDRLRCPVWATPFAAEILRGKLIERGLDNELVPNEVALGGKLTIGDFDLQFISLTHSILEANALAIETPGGRVLHTGDWKLDPNPVVGLDYNEDALRELGDKGVLALIGDSTNATADGHSGSETDVQKVLSEICRERSGRIAITTFASNVARTVSAAAVAKACGRHLVLAGRSLWRSVAAARATGYLDDIGPFLEADEGGYLPPDKVLYLCTGCQGEPRGEMALIARGDHPDIVLGEDDTVIFSSKVIPGNEQPIYDMQNELIHAGVEVIGEKDAAVHVSGHPHRDELRRMYEWGKPTIAVPVHGEIRHLRAHAQVARDAGVPRGIVILNGDMLRLTADGPEIAAQVPVGRLHLDGSVIVPAGDEALRLRRKLGFAGGAVVTVVLNGEGDFLAAPKLLLQGVPLGTGGADLEDRILHSVEDAIEDLPRTGRRDDGRVEEAIRRGTRRHLRNYIDKRPVIEAQIIRV
jgi:ribonuclease J